MKYISAEQFLKLPKEIQEVFLNWWQPQVGDIYGDIDNGFINDINVINSNEKAELVKSWISCKDTAIRPLLKLDQLIDFIQDETGEYIKIDMLCDEWTVTITFTDELLAWEKGNLLEVLWKAAVKVAEMKVRGNDEELNSNRE